MAKEVGVKAEITYTYRIQCCNSSWELSLLAPENAKEEVEGFFKERLFPYVAALPAERREEVLKYLGFKKEDPFGIDIGIEEPLHLDELKRRFALLEERAKR